MSALDLIRGEADVDEDEADESFDEETGEVIRKTNGAGANRPLDDSSEEEDDDDDEDAAREVSHSALVEEFVGKFILICTFISGERRFHRRR